MPDPIRTRKDVWKMQPWDDTLVWYGRAIAEMQTRPISDPTSWRYQAAIHDYIPGDDPLAQPGDQLPSGTDQDTFWAQCQHGSWFFLPWHRMYLRYFEKIVAATIVTLGGPADWALPYWNYSDTANPDARKLPQAFRDLQTPDNQPNTLHIDERDPFVNGGGELGDSHEVDITRCLKDLSFASQGSGGGHPGFGGPRTLFTHGGQSTGDLERVPHGSVHVDVGGNGGFMSAFNTAGLDPIFWLHHANIDRLWEVWRNRDSHHKNPALAQWKNFQFSFHDVDGSVVTLTPTQVVDTTTALLSYQYEDMSDPLAVPAIASQAMAEPTPPGNNPEMVGATEAPITLQGAATTTSLTLSAPTGPAAQGIVAGANLPQSVFLNIENIKGTGTPSSYGVYVNLPDGADPAAHEELFAGILPMFGLAEATRVDRSHPGSGLHYTLEITDVVRVLTARNAWDPQTMRVTFVPRRRQQGQGIAAPAEPSIEVGQVSVYYA